MPLRRTGTSFLRFHLRGPHWALLDDDTVKWVQEKEVLGQEATILVYTRPDGVRDTEAIIIPDDGQEGRSRREMDDAGSVMATTGNNTPGTAERESADTRQSYAAQGDMLDMGDHSLYQELLERAFQDPAMEESDIKTAMMPGPSSRDQERQEEAEQRQETQVFQDYSQEPIFGTTAASQGSSMRNHRVCRVHSPLPGTLPPQVPPH